MRPSRFPLASALWRRRAVLAAVAAALAAAPMMIARAAEQQPSAVRFMLDRKPSAAAAPFLLAAARGYFRSEGLDVGFDSATNTTEAIERVAKGDADMGVADLAALIRYRDKATAAPVKAVFVLFDRTAHAIVGRKSRGINAFADLAGKTLGVADSDVIFQLWPALARANGIDPAKVTPEKVGAAVREPMLSAGQVDAVTSFSYTTPVNLKDRGVPAGDLILFRFADLGSPLYGQAIIVNPRFAAENGEAVSAFVKATLAGLKATLKDPARAVDEILPQMEGTTRDLELDRIRTIIRDNILSEDVKRHGAGAVAPDRFEQGLDFMASAVKFNKRPTREDIFDDSFLPPANARKIP